MAIAEKFADKLANEKELRKAHEEASLAAEESGTGHDAADTTGERANDAAWEVIWDNQHSYSECLLLRDIFGNPFRPITLYSSWLTATGKALAQAIYDDRNFTDLPILADALEEAGCTSDEILNHCRQPGDHVRGCWVVDLLLGKN